MELKLTLDARPTPADEIKPRQDSGELRRALIKIANDLIAQVKKEKKALKYELNNLPKDIKQKSVQGKIFGMIKEGDLPSFIKPVERTLKEVDANGDVKKRKVLYMRCDVPPADGAKKRGA